MAINIKDIRPQDIEKAKKNRMKIRQAGDFGHYTCETPLGKVYTARCFKLGKEKFVQCTCPRGQFNQSCYHAPAFVQAHIAHASMKQAAEKAQMEALKQAAAEADLALFGA